jgi:plastocyanin
VTTTTTTTKTSTSAIGAANNTKYIGIAHEIEQHHRQSSSSPNSNKVSIVNGAATLGNKAFLPDRIRIKVGSTVTWTWTNNNDKNLHTVTSGRPNTVNVGEMFDSGLTALITPSKTYSHTFTKTGQYSYFCRVYPTMVGKLPLFPDNK